MRSYVTPHQALMRHRTLIVTVANLLVAVAAYGLAFLLRFDFSIPRWAQDLMFLTAPAAVLIQYVALYVFKLTRGWWRYVGVSDFVNGLKAVVVGALALATYVILVHRGGSYPRSVILLNAVLVLGLSMGMRLSVRLWRQRFGRGRGVDSAPENRKKLLIIGAGDTGEALLREIRQSNRMNYHVVAFLDDDPRKRGAYINGVPVMDGVDAAPDVVKRHAIDEIVVATPSASGGEMRTIIDVCRTADKPFKVMPATWELLDGVRLGALREVDVSDLLRRPPVQLDVVAIGRFLKGKRVLVTGAAGSIGSEVCRQVLRQGPRALVCLDHDENALFYLERSLSKQAERIEIKYRLGDITDVAYLEALFSAVKPQVVFHAAAHKHVPMLESNPVEGMRNNVLGTEAVATLAGRHDVEAFVLISTDKAVNPSSVMGASKRIAEQIVRTLPFETRYTAVRFGNVLGSQGSVVPLLKEQIAAGGPVTITHPDMLRYFMTIPEAVELVIQAGAMGQGDEVFVLDMGEPVKILDLAHDLIALSGLRPGIDIEVVFTGIRPGEKLQEELHLGAETCDRTAHEKILTAKHAALDVQRFQASLAELRRAVAAHDDVAVRRLIPELVPEYQRQRSTTGSNVIPFSAARRS
jgi:FlaA1/EpsC-like NDP-sugar epimerase